MPLEYPIQEANVSSAFGAIYQGIRDFRSEVNKAKTTDELKKSSAAKQAKDLVMSFPVLCSDAVDPKTALMICKALEKQHTLTMQMLFTSIHLQGSNGADVIKKFHNNIDTEWDISDYMDYAAGAVANAANYGVGGSAVRAANSFFKLGTYGEAALADFKEQCRHYYPQSSFSESSISDYFVYSDIYGYDVHRSTSSLNEANDSDYQERNYELNRDNRDTSRKNAETNRLNYKLSREKYNTDKKTAARKDIRDFNYKKDRDKISDDQFNQQMALNYDRYEQDKLDSYHNYITKQLMPSDVQKANEIVPTLMLVRFSVQDDKAVETVREFVAGVKCRLISVPSEEIMEELSTHKKNKIDNLQFARATTKEISFAKDFMGAVKQAKLDAQKTVLSQTSQIWRDLQARSAMLKGQQAVHGRASAAEITTLVITKQESDFLKINYNIDLTNVNVARSFMKDYNLYAIIIADEQSEIINMISSECKHYQRLSYTAMERENRTSERQIVDILSKVQR